MIGELLGPGAKGHDGATNTPGLGARHWHPTKGAGEQTDYGDMALIGLDYATTSPFEKGAVYEPQFAELSFAEHWRDWFRGYTGYRNFASSETLQNIDSGTALLKAASTQHDDFSGLARAAGLLFLPELYLSVQSKDTSGFSSADDGGSGTFSITETKINGATLAHVAARSTAVTNDNVLSMMATDFFLRVTTSLILNPERPGVDSDDREGMVADRIRYAVTEASAHMQGKFGPKSSSILRTLVQWAEDKVVAAAQPAASNFLVMKNGRMMLDDVALMTLGDDYPCAKIGGCNYLEGRAKSSAVIGALPASLYFILRYADDLPQALQRSAMCGGDSAARAVAIGMVLGAAQVRDMHIYGSLLFTHCLK